MPSKRRCVIKILHPASDNPPELQEIISKRFEREAAVLETLGESIDQIPKLYAYFEEEGEYYLVQELVEGQTLGERVSKEGAMSEVACRQFLTSFLELLDRVHSQGIIHRDIKPSNIIMRARDGKPVLIDFGIVKETVSLSVDETGNTRTLPFGTRGYSPIEQAWGTPVFASDLYSLGVTTIYLLAGKSPGDTPEMIDPSGGGIIWRNQVPNISSGFAAILDKAIKPSYRDRYSSAREMLEAVYNLTSINPPPVRPQDRPARESAAPPPEAPAEEARRARIRQMVIEGNEAFNSRRFELALARWAEVLRLSPDETGVVENIKAAQEAMQEEAALQAGKRRLVSEAAQAFNAGKYEVAIQKWQEALRIAPDEPDLRDNIQLARQKQREAQERANEAMQQQARKQVEVTDPFRGQPFVDRQQGVRRDDLSTAPFRQQSQGQQMPVEQFATIPPVSSPIPVRPVKRGVGWLIMLAGIGSIAVLLIVFLVTRNLWRKPINSGAPSETATTTPTNTDTDAKGFYNIGKALYDQKKYAEAEIAYRKAVAIAPNDASYHNHLGDVLYKQKKSQEAEASFKKAIAINSNDAMYHSNLGIVLDELKRYAEAELSYKKAIAINPNNADYYYNLGIALRAQNKYAEAEATYKKAIGIDPNDARYHNNLGNVLDDQKKYAEAEAAYKKALAIDPNDAMYHNNLANTLFDQKKYAEAEAAYRKTIVINPGNADYHYNLGIALRAQSKYAEAEAAYKKALAINPNDAKYHNNLGNALHDQKRYVEAEAAFRRATTINPNDAMYHSNLGRALYDQKRYAEAGAAYRRALAIDPNYTQAQEGLKKLPVK